MGSSTTYVVLAGVAETVGGALLLFPRLATLGALIVVPVMANVVLMNFCYDIPVKIHSSHILGLTLFLLLPEARRLADVIVFGRPVEAARHVSILRLKGKVRAALQAAVAAALIVPQVLANRATAGRLAERSPALWHLRGSTRRSRKRRARGRHRRGEGSRHPASVGTAPALSNYAKLGTGVAHLGALSTSRIEVEASVSNERRQ